MCARFNSVTCKKHGCKDLAHKIPSLLSPEPCTAAAINFTYKLSAICPTLYLDRALHNPLTVLVSITSIVAQSMTHEHPFLHTVHTLLLLSCVWLFVTPWTTAHQASLSFTISQSWLKLMSSVSMMPSNTLIFCWPFSSLHAAHSIAYIRLPEACIWSTIWSYCLISI